LVEKKKKQKLSTVGIYATDLKSKE